jgi:hypothetical protein
MKEGVRYKEVQVLGRNMSSLLMRIFLALFCLALAMLTGDERISNDLLFLVAGFMIVVSMVLLFINHLTIEITGEELVLSRTFRRKEVRIPLTEIKSTARENYSRYFINYPSFNLHSGNEVKFYTYGKYAVRLTFSDMDDHIIGTADPDEFISALQGK